MSKYRAIRTGKHASKKEHRRSQELELLQQIGEISDLQEQVRFEVIPKQDGERAAHYIADFVYIDKTGQVAQRDVSGRVIEDTKGFRTPDYILKRKLMKLVHGITILET